MLYGTRIDYTKYVYVVLFFATTQMVTLSELEVMCNRLRFDASQTILSVPLVLLLISPFIPKNNACHMVLFREKLFKFVGITGFRQ
jgi:hypothetical protein